MVMFTLEFICTCTLHQLIGDSVPVICTTMEVFLLHSSFREGILRKGFCLTLQMLHKKVGVTVKECVDDFMNELHNQVIDMGKAGEERDNTNMHSLYLNPFKGMALILKISIKQMNFSDVR